METIYVKAYMSNGLCGCDEEYVMAIDIPEYITDDNIKLLHVWDVILENYTYEYGFCGIETYEEDAEELGYDLDEWYHECLKDNCCYDTISKEEFDRIVEEGEIEVR